MPKFESKTEIDAPINKVWEVMTNPAYWPDWFPGIDAVSNITAIEKGGTFNWTDDGRTGKGIIREFEQMKRIEIRTQIGEDQDSHIFELRPSGGFLGLNADECQVEYTLDTLMGGGILGEFIAGGNPRDAMRVKKALHLLRRLVESV
jgi:uncharacterized protein YndB with AHSA1/START domain